MQEMKNFSFRVDNDDDDNTTDRSACNYFMSLNTKAAFILFIHFNLL